MVFSHPKKFVFRHLIDESSHLHEHEFANTVTPFLPYNIQNKGRVGLSMKVEGYYAWINFLQSKIS